VNFPLRALGPIVGFVVATLPLAVGLDAMRQLAFVESDFPVGTPPPQVEALILVVMTVVFIGLARWMLRTLERMARREGRLSVRWQ
jgi:ABC-2 type transport system permease protein